ncbi:MAG: SAM-dependent methyltransferase [Candidatus Pseudobacter hemicellulosilyticus]|uniref:SAM-dependent methyltransferase n=1 Tax=Candidatus Pseudobacter hemicellulosilyticus TaxID=3121375 RepID=A0AAJ5WTG3_9BACT|nr:MAG: SAM-dependent methyltransferase [Pseudobacter sp.]
MPTVYLIPSYLFDPSPETLSPAVLPAVQDCSVFFVENERSARRFLKSIWKEMVIDNYSWFTIHKAEAEVQAAFRQVLKEGKNIGIISEAGCPGVADPGQLLVQTAHAAGAKVKPLVGPSSILLALMASGMNGQQFRFVGYLPIDNGQRAKVIKDLEADARKNNCTQLFIETPYRNQQLLETLLKTCQPDSRLCIASDITAPDEFIRTLSIREWKQQAPALHKRPTIFCLIS